MSVKKNPFGCSYLLSCEEDENNLVKFLTTMTGYFWLKYDFENLKDPEDLNKVVFRMALKASYSGNKYFWNLTWEKIELLHLEKYVLTESNYEVVNSTVICSEEFRPFILHKAKENLDDNDYKKMLTLIVYSAVLRHSKALYGVVYNNVDCLNFLWDSATYKEKWIILKNFNFSLVKKLFRTLFVKHILEDEMILRFLTEMTNFQPDLQYNLFLSDKKAEDVLSDFLNSPTSQEPLAKMHLLWQNTFAKNTVENQGKALLRLYVKGLVHANDNVSRWAWEKSLQVEQRKYIFQGANYYAAKFILEICPQYKLQQFVTEAVNYLNGNEIIELLTELVEDTVYWHGRIFDDKVVNNLKQLQLLMTEFSESTLKMFDTIQVFRSLKMATKTKLNVMLKYADLEDSPEALLGSYILTNKTAENELLNFIDAINRNELSEKSLTEEWNSRRLGNLNYRNLYSAIFRVFILSIGSSNDIRLQWIWKIIEESSLEIKVLKEQSYFFIKTVMDLSDADLLKRALQIAVKYLNKDEMHCMYKEAYLHAVKWHGAFVNDKIWNATLSLQTLKKLSCRHQWDNLFEHLSEKFASKTKRHLDGQDENCSGSKKTRCAGEKTDKSSHTLNKL